MADSIEFYVDDKLCESDKPVLSVAEILAKVSKSADKYYLISSDNTRYINPKQQLEVRPGDHFKTEKRDGDKKPLISYKVNGEQLSTFKSTLTVEEILRAAGKAASVDLQQLDSYYLENIKTAKKYEHLADIVEIMDKDEFLAVHSGATPVAHIQML